MAAAAWNIVVESNANFKASVTWNDPNGNPIDITGYTLVWTLQTKNGQKIIASSSLSNGGTNGVITINVPWAITSSWSGNPPVTHDLVVVSLGNEATRLAVGNVNYEVGISTP